MNISIVVKEISKDNVALVISYALVYATQSQKYCYYFKYIKGIGNYSIFQREENFYVKI